MHENPLTGLRVDGDHRVERAQALRHEGAHHRRRLIVQAIAEFVAVPADQPYEQWEELIDGIVAACVHILDGA